MVMLNEVTDLIRNKSGPFDIFSCSFFQPNFMHKILRMKFGRKHFLKLLCCEIEPVTTCLQHKSHNHDYSLCDTSMKLNLTATTTPLAKCLHFMVSIPNVFTIKPMFVYNVQCPTKQFLVYL